MKAALSGARRRSGGIGSRAEGSQRLRRSLLRYAMLPAPARIATPPSPNSQPSCQPAVPPPPVAGAAVGNGLGDVVGDALGDELGLGDAAGEAVGVPAALALPPGLAALDVL
jgi:hypothetical protein